MPIKVNAHVVDLTSDTPKDTDVFFVDSNVWYWVGYTNASINAKTNQSTDYPTYINQALAVGSTLHKCTLSFTELAHNIEKSEWEIFKSVTGKQITIKNFRHDYPTERANTVTEIENAWLVADAITSGQTIEVNLTTAAIQSAQNRMKSEALDGYDLFMVDALLASNVSKVITDDSDFGQVSGITVFTANQHLIRQARTQGKLIVR